MCDPITLSLIGGGSAAAGGGLGTALSTAATIAGVVGSGINALGAMRAQKRQEKNIDSWAARQNMNREAEQARQEDLRGRAEQARQQGLTDLSADAQKQTQTEEEARLAEYLNSAEATPEPGVAVSGADKSLVAPASDDPGLQSDLASKLANATAGAKQRLQALARVSSYTGSSGGLGIQNKEALAGGGRGIDAANEKRRGSLSAYGLERGIDPVQVQYQPSPLADIFSGIGQLGAQGLGNAAGKATFSKRFPAAPTTPFKLPYTTTSIPTPRPVF
jgi:hypothetical protein